MKMETLFTQIKNDARMSYMSEREHDYRLIDTFLPSHEGAWVLVGYGVVPSIRHLIARLVQIRPREGSFGSDVVIVQEFDGRLQTWENQGFTLIPEKYHSQLEPFWSKWQHTDVAITREGKDPRSGFIAHRPEKAAKGER